MATFKSDFMRVVHERGMVHQCSDTARLDELLSTGTRTAYIGFDCTADSLHVGHLLQIMLLRWWQKTGHQPIALMGGGTTKVGDPSGRDETRQLLTPDQINANMAEIKKSFANYLTFGSGPRDAIMANNADWLDNLQYIPLLRDIGRHFSVNRMLTMDSVKLRLERDQPLTFLEFNYMILQSYDYVELYRRHKCILQMGGSDQWGNIVMGADPRPRRVEGAELFAPDLAPAHHLVGRQDGQDRRRCRVAQSGAAQPLRILAILAQHRGCRRRPLPEALHRPAAGGDRQARGAAGPGDQRGEEGPGNRDHPPRPWRRRRGAGSRDAPRTFEEGAKAEALPTVDVAREKLAAGIAAFELFHEAGLADSLREARKLIKGGGGRLNDKPIAADTAVISEKDLEHSVRAEAVSRPPSATSWSAPG